MTEPGGILGDIVRRKRADVAARMGETSLADLRAGAERTHRSLASALGRPGARFVMEVKRASPSAGLLRAAADPAAIARAYAPTADAISVLVDTPYFGGSYADLAAVRAAFDGPVLAKDFVVDPRQVPEARRHGADAVLVMLSVLDDDGARDVMAEAERLGMEALVEAHDEAEVHRAVALGARLIGINNRDLKTLKVDLASTERLAGLVPRDRLVVAESGIKGRADVARLAPFADAFLVGSALMEAPDIALAARGLAVGRVKICGLTRDEDVRRAVANGAAYAGFVMVPGTPRAVVVSAAAALADTARQQGVATVGVFRDAPLGEVADTARLLALDAVQLHGGEDDTYLARLRDKLGQSVEIWAASAVGEDDPVERPGADRLLFDTAVNGQSGGTGRMFDWGRVAARPDLGTSILAGGLSPDNAAAATRLGAFALDVGSGVEAAPGRKDPDKLAAFFAALRTPARGELECV